MLAVIVVPGRAGLHRADAINIDADVVVVDVLELGVLNGVELDGEDMVACIATALSIEESQKPPCARGREICAGGNEEGHTVGAQVGGDGEDGEHERDGERIHHAATVFLAEAQRLRVEGMAFELPMATAQLEEAAGRDRRHAIKGELGTTEPIVDESSIVDA